MKYLVSVVLVICMVLMMVGAVSAAQGTWKSYASDGSGSLTGGTQYAYYQTRIGSVLQPEVKVPAVWSVLYSEPDKPADFSDTVNGVWNINDNATNQYLRIAITPESFDASRGIVMAKIKVNSASSLNGTFGFSTSTGFGLQVALRNGAWRIRNGEGDPLSNYIDPADITTTDYHVYALSWVGNTANVWYSNGADWSSDPSQWTQVMTNYTMPGGSATRHPKDGPSVNGIVMYTPNSSQTWNGDIQWIAHNTYDNAAGEMNPWDFNPAPVPEPSSLVALASGLFGVAGFAIRRRR